MEETQKDLSNEKVKNRPVSYTKGNLKLNEWTNKSEDNSEFNSYTIEKFYKNSLGKWNTSNIFSLQELQNISVLISEFLALNKPIVKKTN